MYTYKKIFLRLKNNIYFFLFIESKAEESSEYILKYNVLKVSFKYFFGTPFPYTSDTV